MRLSFRVVAPWKMATVKSLEDMLASEVDESAVDALVGSLESQLASTNVNASSQDVNTTSSAVNHVNSTPLVDGAVIQILDGQKHVHNTVNQPPNIGKTSGTVAQVVDGQPASSSVMVTLPGALPASGYITQVTGAAQQTLFAPAASGTIAVNRALTTSNQDIKIVYTTQSAVAGNNGTNAVLRNNLQASMPNGSPTPVTMIALRPGQSLASLPAVSAAISTPTTSMSAIHDLANIASQQTPIVIPSTCNSVGATVQSTTLQSKTINKPVTRMQLRERGEKNAEKTSTKVGVTTRSQEAASAAANNVAAITTVAVTTTQATVATTTISKAPTQTSHHVNMVSQVVTNSSILPPGVQIINVNPRLSAQGLAGAKALAPRVVLSNPLRIATAPQIMTTTRPGVAGQRCMTPINPQLKAESSFRQMHVARAPLSSPKFIPLPQNKNTITLQPGVMRGAIIVKTDNGPLQVVNLASASGGAIPGGTTYRLQSIQGPGTPTVRTMSPQQMTVTVPVSGATVKGSSAAVSGTQTIVGTILQQGSTLNTARLAGPNITSQTHQAVAVKVGVNGNIATPLTIQTTTNNQTPSAPSQMSPNTAKKKCKNFLSTLIRLADEQPPSVAKSVRSLIQGIIDGTIQAEEFTAKLQKELNSAPQPYLVPFLKKNLPFLRHSLITKELTIEGVRPPPPGALSLPHPQLGSTQQTAQKRPLQPGTQVRLSTTPPVSLAARLLQTNQNTLAQRFAGPRLPGVAANQPKSVLVNSVLNKNSAAALSPATVGALQAKSPSLIKGPSIFASKDKGKNSFSALRDDDDINDVAAMGGVNLIEESQKILASNSELVGTQIRSCKDESCFVSGAFQRRLHAIALKHGLEDVSPEVTALVAFAAQERLKTMLEKLAVIAEHRVENAKGDQKYEVTQDVKSQIKFLEELDRLERRRHEEQEREILLRAAKSRSKLEDPEQLKLKQKAKEMQRAELEEMRQREANTTALLAIGPRKKMKFDPAAMGPNQVGNSSTSGLNSAMPKALPRPRVKRVNMRDLLYLMEHDRETVRTPLLYRSYLK